MTENQPISKRGEMDHQPVQDLLSDLPLCIIHNILERAPIRDVVKTSFLSRQWRYKWTSIPHLVFYHSCASPQDKYENFINQVLIHHKGPIHKFTVCCPVEVVNFDEWVLSLSKNGIRELILDPLEDSVLFTMHSSMYSCENLTCLELFRCEFDPPPSTFKGFLFLKTLVLNSIFLSSDEIRRFVSVCPVLERFELVDFEGSENYISVHAPNLKYFNIVGHYIEVYLYAPLLTELYVDLRNEDFTFEYEYTNFLDGFTALEKLNGGCYFTKYLSFAIESYHHSLVFHHLKHIELVVNLQDAREISAVARLVMAAPNLHMLKLIIIVMIALLMHYI